MESTENPIRAAPARKATKKYPPLPVLLKELRQEREQRRAAKQERERTPSSRAQKRARWAALPEAEKQRRRALERERRRTWASADPEHRRARWRAWWASLSEAEKEAERARKRAQDSANPAVKMLRKARTRAQRLNVPFHLAPSDIVIPDKCPALGMKLRKANGASCDASPTLDRFVSAEGYVPGNVHVVSMRANRLKRNFTPAQLRARAAASRDEARARDLLRIAVWMEAQPVQTP